MQQDMARQSLTRIICRTAMAAFMVSVWLIPAVATQVNNGTNLGVPPVRVLYLDGHTAQYKAAFQDYVNAWSRTSGIPISIVIPKVTGVLVVDEYMSMLNVMTAQNKSFWDIVYIDVIWPALYTGLLLPLNNFLSPGFLERFDPGFIPAATVDNQIYVLPESTPKVGLYYRADLLAKYNFTSPPKTWTEVEHMIKTIVPAERARGNSVLEGYIGQLRRTRG
ncbi:hypothetical protein BCR44DRAFT_1069432 [Catenaria anguillulae PL171]|uniref:Extracellular solute-binding protein n=1 Tax=Catenaria anguillulae PL171 TaxID=765915 RepID=A0A1Y2HSA4_9FUNG|nr:hypothetical protein BCR44DRAFT_1069432 [Catenaria anguillulae PL171]